MILAAALGTLAAIDVGTSLIGLSSGYPEAAPGMAAIVSYIGIWAIIPVKAILTIITLALIARIKDRSQMPAWIIALALFAYPAVNNLTLLIQDA